MQPDYSKLTFFSGDSDIIEGCINSSCLPVFDRRIVRFLAALSTRLLKSASVRAYPDIAAFAFWIREKNLENEAKRYADGNTRVGRGCSFHIAPSNIPVQFAVTMVYALLAGNSALVRVSSKCFPQTEIICAEINELLSSEYKELRERICIFSYSHDSEITDYLSMNCDARVIWGGDNTISAIKQSPTLPRTVDFCFADRHSIAIINSDNFLLGEHRVLANDFYQDTFFVDQNACSSPRIVVWTGENISKAKEIFWGEVEKLVEEKYTLPPIKAIDKLDKLCLLAAQKPDMKVIKRNNKLVRIETDSLSGLLMDYKENCGFFFEYTAKSLKELKPLFTKACQTVVYYGIDEREITDAVVALGVKGVDRIVPLGHSLELSFIWDGTDLIEGLSRIIGQKGGK